MRNFSKKLAFVLAAAMVFTAFAPAAKADAAEKMVMNRASQTLYVNEGVNDKGAETLPEGLYGNVQEYDFYVKNKPANYAKELKFAWESSDEKVATVDNKGLTKAVAVGTATITCTITDKATGDEVAEATAKVTVKANAADVVITNAEDYDNLPVPEDGVVDLNRAMYDENDTKTTKRGKVVTDYTRWIAEDADGEAVDATVVAIDQATGKFTFAADAPAGDYALYCQTYQSDKYNQTTAESEKVTVTVVDSKNVIETVVQKSATKFVLEFKLPVKALAVADVDLTRLLKVGNSTYEYPEQIKVVTLSKDGLSADVEIFGSLADKTDYVIDVTGFESVNKTMTLGKPTRMTLSAKGAQVPYVLTVDAPTEIVCTFYNDDDVDVTTGKENVVFRLEDRSTDGSYYLAGNKLTIKKEGVYPVVIADYQGWIENGKKVGNFSQPQEFTAVKQTPVVVSGVSQWTVNGKWDGDKSTTMRKSANPVLNVEVVKSDGNTKARNVKDTGAYTDKLFANDEFKLSFTAMNPDIAVVSSVTGKVTAFKTGTAYFYVNLHAKKANSSEYEATGTPIAIIDVTVEKDAAFDSVSLDNYAITIGTATGFDTGSVKLTSLDNYTKKFAFDDSKAVTVECNMDGFDKTAFADAIKIDYPRNDKNEITDDCVKVITFDANEIDKVLAKKELSPKDGDAAVVYFTVKYNNKSLDLTVTIQKPSKEGSALVGNYINIESSATYVDAVRKLTPNDWNDNTEKAKTVTFKVFELNNGVKVNKLAFGAYPANGDATAVTSGDYVYRVLKDGKDYASKQSGNEVTIAFSTTKGVSNGALNAEVVDYTNMGAGTYEFALYKCYGEGKDRVLVQEYSSMVSVDVSSAGTYELVGDIVDNDVEVTQVYNKGDQDEILKCFNIKDKDGNDVIERKNNTVTIKKDLFFVDYTAPVNAGYVYVKDVTFYEKVADGVYVPYVVSIDTVLYNK